jgi:hypothetical protein
MAGKKLQSTARMKERTGDSRHCLAESLVASLYADWCEHGVTAIEKVRQERPVDYLKIIASIIPKEVHVGERSSFEDVGDEELSAMIDMLRNSIASVKH